MRCTSFFVLLMLGIILNAEAGTRPAGPERAVGRDGSFLEQSTVAAPRTHRPLDDIALSEGFELVAPGELPPNWNTIDSDGGYCSWFQRNSTWQSYSRPGFSAHSGTRFVMCHYNDNSLANDDWLVLPQQNLGGPISLNYWAASQDPDYPESFEVRVSTGGNQPADFTNLIFTGSDIPGVWTPYSHDLSAYAGAPFYVAFHYNATNRFVLKLDDVEVEGNLGATGTISGTVVDNSSQGIEYARVAISSLGRSVRTGADGHFVMENIPVGSYFVRTEQQFFYVHLEPNVTVAADETTHVDIALSPRPMRFYEYVSQNTPRPITDFDTSGIVVFMCHDSIHCDTFIIADVDVTVSLNHTYVGDLEIWITSPDSDYIGLVAPNPNDDGQNLIDARFDDQADLPFTASQAPHIGRWRPAMALSRYNGDTSISIRGNEHYRTTIWALHVRDAAAGDDGLLYGFQLHFAALLAPEAAEPGVRQPLEFSFDGNYPNPFNGQTRFRFMLPHEADVTLTLYNILGRQAAVILDRPLEAGEHIVLFDSGGLSSGVYFAALTSSRQTLTHKVLILR